VNNMQMHITPNNKLASLGTIGLLFLAGIAGMVFLLPASPVHAASPTVSLSTISSGTLTAATSGTVGSTLVITGSGFLGSKPIGITTTIGTTKVPWLTQGTCASGAGFGTGSSNSLVTPTGAAGCLTSTAIGNFQVTVTVPALPGGPQTIVVTDGTNSYSAAFSITPAIVMSTYDLTGFPGEALGVTSTIDGCVATICLTGFGAGDTVTITSTVSGTLTSLTTGATGDGLGTYGVVSALAGSFIVADNTGGSHVITATDSTATPNLVATATFTVSPWVAFYDTPRGTTTFSVTAGTALTSLYIDGHGFPAGTISAGSITVGGQAVTFTPITVGSSGAFTQLQVGPPSGGFALGNLAVVIGGTTFSYGAGNIADSAVAAGIYAAGGILSPGTASQENWGGTLIGSLTGTAAAGTAFITLQSTSYKPGTPASAYYGPAPKQNQIGIFGYGFVHAAPTPGVAAGSNAPNIGAITYLPGYQSTTCTTGTGANCVDGNGAFFATTLLGDTPYSNTVPASSTATSYGITAPNGGNNPASIITPSFVVTPWIDSGSITGYAINYESTLTWTVHGFGDGESVVYSVGGTSFPTPEAVTVGATGTGTAVASLVPDLAEGATSVTATGSVTGQVASVSAAVVYSPIVDNQGGTAATAALFPNGGNSGSTTILRTGSTYGVHGLAANTPYTVVWNAISGAVTLGTFTSTSTGGIPAPGVQVTIPSDTSGIHILDIQATSSLGTSALYGSVVGDYAVPDQGITYTTQYGDLLFALGANLIASPTAANVGNFVTLTGTGLQAGTTYDVGLVKAVGNSCVGQHGNAVLAAFTATSTGTVPASVGVTLTDQPTTAGAEQATLYCLSVQTSANFNTANGINSAAFELQASASLNMTTAPVGHNVVMTAHALAAGSAYNIIFNPSVSIANAVSGEVIGAVLGSANGAGLATFTTPNVTPGTYAVQLCPANVACTTANEALAASLTLTVGSVPTTCNTTSCMVASGTPTSGTQGSYNGVSSSFTNNSNAPVTGFVYAVVHNALGQTVDISTATISASSGGSANAFNVLFGLAPGTYSVTLFVTSSAGTAISSTSTVSVTIP